VCCAVAIGEILEPCERPRALLLKRAIDISARTDAGQAETCDLHLARSFMIRASFYHAHSGTRGGIDRLCCGLYPCRRLDPFQLLFPREV